MWNSLDNTITTQSSFYCGRVSSDLRTLHPRENGSKNTDIKNAPARYRVAKGNVIGLFKELVDALIIRIKCVGGGKHRKHSEQE